MHPSYRPTFAKLFIMILYLFISHFYLVNFKQSGSRDRIYWGRGLHARLFQNIHCLLLLKRGFRSPSIQVQPDRYCFCCRWGWFWWYWWRWVSLSEGNIRTNEPDSPKFYLPQPAFASRIYILHRHGESKKTIVLCIDYWIRVKLTLLRNYFPSYDSPSFSPRVSWWSLALGRDPRRPMTIAWLGSPPESISICP